MNESALTNEEMQELTALREEKKTRLQTERAAGALCAAGVPQSFAALLIGDNDEETDRRVQSFCETYQNSLSQDIRKRLPTDTPTLTAPIPQRPKRGICRIR